MTALLPDSSWDGTFEGHTEEGEPLVPVKVNVQQNAADPEDIMLTVGGLHLHLNADDVLALCQMLTAATPPELLAREIIAENASPETRREMMEFLLASRDAAIKNLKEDVQT